MDTFLVNIAHNFLHKEEGVLWTLSRWDAFLEWCKWNVEK